MKKLNDVLNGVMNDILTEAEYADGYGPADLPGGTTSGIYGYRYGQPGNPNGVPAGEDPAASAGLTDRLAQMWAGLSDNEKMAIIGGAGGTALAAGAGALYLRKKQRDANRAMGR